MSTSCLRTLFPIHQYTLSDPLTRPRPGSLSFLNAPAFVREKVGLRLVEVWSFQFEALTDEYMRELKEAARKAGTRLANLQVDDVPNEEIGSADEKIRNAALANRRTWIDRAALLGVRSLRFNPGGFIPGGASAMPPPFDRICDGFREIARYGKKKGVMVLLENHAGYSGNIDNAVRILKGVSDPNFRAIIDWGNGTGGGTGDPLDQRSKMAPWLYLVSAKAEAFDSESRPTDIDVARYVKATESWGFKGIYSIELYGQNPADPVRAAAAMRDMIAANLSS